MRGKDKFEIGIFMLLFLVALVCYVYAEPVGTSATYVKNSTSSNPGNATLNYSGGYIMTVNLVSNEQNTRWKAFVGNVTGTLKLDDADGYSIYSWDRTTTSGEVYAVRTPNAITWADINCSTSINTTAEEIALGHTANPNDNISATFNDSDHVEFYVGTERIAANTCNTTNLAINDTMDLADDFEEVLLHDGSYMVYAAIIESDISGYRAGAETYDYQMMVPENASSGFSGATPYYFYVELT
jgi:hypothetical protein